jgi:hypothetical protein
MNTHNRDNFEPRGKREMYRKQLMEYKIYWAKIVANSSDFGLRFFFQISDSRRVEMQYRVAAS